MKNNFNFNFTRSKLKAPCQNCPNREVGCRTKCIPWQEYQELKDEEEAEKKLRFGYYFK